MTNARIPDIITLNSILKNFMQKLGWALGVGRWALGVGRWALGALY